MIGFLTLTPGGAAAADQVAWLARHLAQLKVGLALGAGGARGFAHFGVLRGLQRLGVPVDYVVGTSVGSIVAAGVASGTNVEDMIEDMATASAGSVRRTLSRHSLLSNRGLIGALRETVGDVRIENLPLPFAAVAVDLLRHTEVVLSEGFALAVRARVERDTRCLSTRVD